MINIFWAEKKLKILSAAHF